MRSPDVLLSYMIGPMVAPLADFLRHGMVSGLWGELCYSREWVWNSMKILCWEVVGKSIVSMALLQEFYVGYMMF